MKNSIKIDKKDLQILKLLGENCRFQLSTLARALNLSKDTVRNRIGALEEKKIITHYNTIINPRALGFSKFQILIKFKNNATNIPLLAEKLKKHKSLSFMNSLIGKYDLHLIIDTKNIFTFDKTKSEILEILKGTIQSHTVLTFFGDIKHTNLIPETEMELKVNRSLDTSFSSLFSSSFEVEQDPPNHSLDSLDMEIIKILTKNPKETLVQMSELLKYNRETIKQRITKLIKSKVIMNFGANTSFEMFDYTTYFILIKINKDFSELELKNSFRRIPNIFYCAKTQGEYSLITYVLSKSPTQLKETIKKIKTSLEDIITDIDILIFDELFLYKQLPKRLIEELKEK